ncbi:hypothetical protein B0H10DRAFT_2189650 [Mycena sp. CBHHK59/15]|nr:hypothetical protein B0H10DRAFT_2189650 [Mycena sp. CBHHK59/15]
MPRNAPVKTLYTAKFYETPSSSESTNPSSLKPHPSAYAARLFEKHVSLAEIPEAPDSRPGSPESEHMNADSEQVNPERVEALRKQVVEAYNAASGNPANGKWGLLTALLQTGAAKSRYRWHGTKTDAVPPKPPSGGRWFLPDTEEEWFEWEKKREDDLRLQEKVENWQRTVDPEARMDIDIDHEPGKVLSDESQTAQATHSRDRKSVSASVKRRAAPSHGAKASSVSRLQSRPNARSIAELPETTFLPPSFPNNLETSTPPVARRKPSPIQLVPSSSPISSPPKTRIESTSGAKHPPSSPIELVPSSSPLSSPKNSRVYGRLRAPDSSPPKRPRTSSPTPLQPAKKAARMIVPSSSGPTPPTSPSPFKRDGSSSKMPITPPGPLNPLPKLEDLLAASAQKKALAKKKGKQKEKQPVRKPKQPSPKPPSPKIAEEAVSPGAAEEQRRLDLEAGIGVLEDDVINWDHTLERLVTEQVADALASPTKSLSSIDGSNSLESQETDPEMPDFSHGAPFDPQGGSTQPMCQLECGGASLGTTEQGGRGFGQQEASFSYPMRYESQMDVESNMQGVEELLDADVGRYTGPWMGTGPDDDDDEQWGGRGSGQLDTSP